MPTNEKHGCSGETLLKPPAVNLLTPAVVKDASREIATGEHIQLDWSLENVQFGGFGRLEFKQNLIDLNASLGFKAFDDEIHLNTQIGSQWDSLKHVRKGESKQLNHDNG